jgi:hypothetical protein
LRHGLGLAVVGAVGASDADRDTFTAGKPDACLVATHVEDRAHADSAVSALAAVGGRDVVVVVDDEGVEQVAPPLIPSVWFRPSSPSGTFQAERRRYGLMAALVVILLLLALLIGGVGLFVAGLKWLLIIALVLLLVGLITGMAGRRRTSV